METPLPISLQPLIATYLKGLAPLCSHFYGIYIYGSIALDAFEEQESDIDIIALMQGEWTSDELMQLAAVHAQLLREQPQSQRLDVQYLPLRDVGKMGTIAPHPLLRDGKFVPATTHGDLNAVTWWITKHQGVRLYCPEPSALPFEVAWKDVLATMRHQGIRPRVVCTDLEWDDEYFPQ